MSNKYQPKLVTAPDGSKHLRDSREVERQVDGSVALKDPDTGYLYDPLTGQRFTPKALHNKILGIENDQDN